MPAYEFRRSDGVYRTYLLASDADASRYAAAVTRRGITVEIWRDTTRLGRVAGTREALLPGAWLFEPPASRHLGHASGGP